jgi:hypothetical protein
VNEKGAGASSQCTVAYYFFFGFFLLPFFFAAMRFHAEPDYLTIAKAA